MWSICLHFGKAATSPARRFDGLLRRAPIEGVRVAPGARSGGLGRAMFEHAIGLAREKGCRMVQLTTDRTRPEALAFYESLGFVHSHAGMKLPL
ncbi:MAG: GNAT family N-acetyltransferase [Rhodospirillales bacterium]